MFKSVYQITDGGTKKKGAQKGDTDKDSTLFNRETIPHKKVGCKSGKGDEGGIEPEPGKTH